VVAQELPREHLVSALNWMHVEDVLEHINVPSYLIDANGIIRVCHSGRSSYCR
jgi:hypothetical protein